MSEGRGVSGSDIAVVGIAAVLLWKGNSIINGIMEFWGIKDTEEEKKQAAQLERIQNLPFGQDYWRPNWWRELLKLAQSKGKTWIVIQDYSPARADMFKLHDLLDKYWSWQVDDDGVIGVIRKQNSQAAISQLADYYQTEYKQDLYSVLKSKLDSDTLSTVLDITEKLPQGIPK